MFTLIDYIQSMVKRNLFVTLVAKDLFSKHPIMNISGFIVQDIQNTKAEIVDHQLIGMGEHFPNLKKRIPEPAKKIWIFYSSNNA